MPAPRGGSARSWPRPAPPAAGPAPGVPPAAPVNATAAAAPVNAAPAGASPANDVLAPSVRKIVEEAKLDVASAVGSGKDGRLTKADAAALAEIASQTRRAAEGGPPAPAPKPGPRFSSARGGRGKAGGGASAA